MELPGPIRCFQLAPMVQSTIVRRNQKICGTESLGLLNVRSLAVILESLAVLGVLQERWGFHFLPKSIARSAIVIYPVSFTNFAYLRIVTSFDIHKKPLTFTFVGRFSWIHSHFILRGKQAPLCKLPSWNPTIPLGCLYVSQVFPLKLGVVSNFGFHASWNRRLTSFFQRLTSFSSLHWINNPTNRGHLIAYKYCNSNNFMISWQIVKNESWSYSP